MTAIYQWHEAYKAALLETDWSKMPERIQAAEAALSQRKRELALDHGGTPEENQAIADAMRGMAVLRDDAARSARVDGKPRIVHQAYLGTAEKLAEMVRDRTAPVPLAATTREFGLPAALWARRSANRRLGLAAIALAHATLRTLARSLPVAGGHPPHLPARPQNRSSRLVSLLHPGDALGVSPRTLYFASFLGRL